MIRQYVKPLLIGFFGALAAFLIVMVCWGIYLTWVRAEHGQQAYEFIANAQRQQQQQAKPAEKPQ